MLAAREDILRVLVLGHIRMPLARNLVVRLFMAPASAPGSRPRMSYALPSMRGLAGDLAAIGEHVAHARAHATTRTCTRRAEHHTTA